MKIGKNRGDVICAPGALLALGVWLLTSVWLGHAGEVISSDREVRPSARSSGDTERSILVATPSVVISPDGTWAEQPCVAVDSKGRVHVVWVDTRRKVTVNSRLLSGGTEVVELDQHDLYHRMCTGSSWTGPQMLVKCEAWGRVNSFAIEADSKGSLHIAWEYWSKEPPKLLYGRWTETSWSKPFELESEEGGGDPSMVAEASGTLHVVCEDISEMHFEPLVFGPEQYAKIQYRRFDGGSWMSPQKLDRRGRFTCENPVIGVDSMGSLHLVHLQARGPHGGMNTGRLTYRRRTKRSWSAGKTLGRVIGPSERGNLDLAVDARDRVHILWVDKGHKSRRNVVYHRVWDGKRWSKATELSREADDAWFVSVASDKKGNTYCVWGGEAGVFCKRWDGAMWSEVLPISKARARSGVDVATDGAGNAHVVCVVGGKVQYRRIESVSLGHEKSD